MELFILRHAIAEEVSQSGLDRDRRLTEEGMERTRESGKALRKLGIDLDLILSSPFVRAWDTARIIADTLGCAKDLHACEALRSGAGAEGILPELRAAARKHTNVLLVGHEPELSQLISILLCGSPGLSITLKKGGLCRLACVSPEPGGARLEWLLTSKQLCRMA